MDLPAQNRTDHGELTLPDLIAVLARERWLVLLFVTLSVSTAAILAWSIPPTYTADIVISPVSDSSMSSGPGAVSSVLSQFGNIASLAGISTSADTRKAESLAVLESEALTDRYIEQNNLLPILYSDKWDVHRARWVEDDPRKAPTLWRAYQYFKRKVRTVATDPKTGIVTLTIEWNDPHLAAKWANGLVQAANDFLREKAIMQSERNISYLNSQAAKTDIVPIKQAIYVLLEAEINKEMLARGNDEYAFKILDPAIAPEKPSSPRPLLWILIAVVGSLTLSVFAAYVRLAWSRLNHPAETWE